MMTQRTGEGGFSLVELLVGLMVTSLLAAGVAAMLLNGSRLNTSRRLAAEAQANARVCLSMVVQRLRTAGWDPMNAGFDAVTLDPDTSDSVSQIEVFADLDEDGLTVGDGEQVTIRHSGTTVSWRTTGIVSDPYVVLATHIDNDSDGNGVPEPMFVPDSTTNPSRITVRITARSSRPDPVDGEFIRYTVSSDVALRSEL